MSIGLLFLLYNCWQDRAPLLKPVTRLLLHCQFLDSAPLNCHNGCSSSVGYHHFIHEETETLGDLGNFPRLHMTERTKVYTEAFLALRLLNLVRVQCAMTVPCSANRLNNCGSKTQHVLPPPETESAFCVPSGLNAVTVTLENSVAPSCMATLSPSVSHMVLESW